MFETLDQINWQELRVAEYNESKDIPDAIRGLLSDDPKIRHRSYFGLDNVVVLQSDLYQAAWYVLPFLWEIIEDPSIVAGRVEAFNLLYEIANGYAPPEIHIELPDGRSESLTLACRKRAIERLVLYLAEIDNPAAPLAARRTAIELIFSYPVLFLSLQDRFEALLQYEPVAEFRMCIQELLDEVGELQRDLTESAALESLGGIEQIGSLKPLVLSLVNAQNHSTIWSIPEASLILIKL